MNNRNHNIEKLVFDAASHLDGEPSEKELERQPEMFLKTMSAVKEREKRRIRPYVLASAAAAAVLLFSALIIWRTSQSENLQFYYGEEQKTGELSALLKAPADASLDVLFDGGSTITLQNQAVVRVLESNTNQVRILLDEGTVAASINGNGHTQWSIFADVYEIRVLGTQFTVDWDADQSRLKVKVTRGVVMALGPLSEQGVSVEAGNEVVVDGKSKSLALHQNKEHTADPSLSQMDTEFQSMIEQDRETLSETNPEDTGQKGNNSKIRASHGNHWKQLYRKGKYKETIAAWKKGTDSSYGTVSATDLWNLANAARYARNQAVAQKALLTIRTRFPTTKHAEASAFLLGKNALELANNPKEASRWFELYLNRYPGGSMSEKAMGRLIQIYKRQGNQTKAKNMATTYLTRFPNGTFAKLAASMHTE